MGTEQAVPLERVVNQQLVADPYNLDRSSFTKINAEKAQDYYNYNLASKNSLNNSSLSSIYFP